MPETSKAVLITGCSTGIGRATAERPGMWDRFLATRFTRPAPD